MKKAQGLSLHFIVIAAIAALVLVLVISFTVGGLGTFFSRMFGTGEEATQESDIDLARTACESYCDKAKQVDAPEDWSREDYCTKTFRFEGAETNCWQAPISETCSVSGTDIYGESWNCNDDQCSKCNEMGCSNTTVTNYNECIAAGETWRQG